jgi:aminoglycoside phosphotransferase (APT) family kinase protein
MSNSSPGTEPVEMQVSSRDPELLRPRLASWLAGRLPPGSSPTVPAVHTNSANGLSSDTVLFEATWTAEEETHDERLVARIAPDADDVPVFPSYDLGRQFEVIRLVGDLTSVPVPAVWWLEDRPQALGAPFFVMSRVDGVVPPDVMPYNFGDSWLFDAPSDEQRRLQDTTVGVLAELHSIERPADRFGFLEFDEAGDTALRRHVAHTRAWYEFAREGHRSPLIERGFEWLDDHWPADEGDPVVSWGDSRIGNVMYRDFEPVAVLDWEMAGLGPRELDLAWLVNAHLVFETLARSLDLEGMPDFLRPDDVAARYEHLTGHAPRHLDWYLTYASVQWGVVFLRTGLRAVHFGEREMETEVDAFLHHRDLLTQMLTH